MEHLFPKGEVLEGEQALLGTAGMMCDLCDLLAEALRVVRPGGRIVIVDYHPPAKYNPLWYLMRAVFATLEPFAIDLWRHEVVEYLPAAPASVEKRSYFGGLYQKLVLVR